MASTNISSIDLKPTLGTFYKSPPTPKQAKQISQRAAAVPSFKLDPPSAELADVVCELLRVDYVGVGRSIDNHGREWYWVARRFHDGGWKDEAMLAIPVWKVIAVAGTVEGLLKRIEEVAAKREVRRRLLDWAA